MIQQKALELELLQINKSCCESWFGIAKDKRNFNGNRLEDGQNQEQTGRGVRKIKFV